MRLKIFHREFFTELTNMYLWIRCDLHYCLPKIKSLYLPVYEKYFFWLLGNYNRFRCTLAAQWLGEIFCWYFCKKLEEYITFFCEWHARKFSTFCWKPLSFGESISFAIGSSK